jgi:type I restriction enzyme S subunit
MYKLKNILLSEISIYKKSNRKEDLQIEMNNGHPLYGPNGIIKYIKDYDIEENAVGIVKWGASAGKIIRIDSKSSVVWTMGYLIPIDGVYFPYYYYLLSSTDFTKFINRSTVSNLYFDDIKDIPLKLHDLIEQQKIGSFLNEIDNLIEKCKKRDLELLNLQKYHLKSLFKPNDSNYKITPLNQVAEIFDGTHQTPNYVDSGIPFVSVEDIKNLSLTSKYITKEDFEKNFKKYPKKDDILMTRIGDIGTSELFEENYPIAFYVSLALIKCKNIYPKFLNQFIKTDFFQKELNKRTIHAAFPKKINLSEIGNCMVIVPSQQVQYKLGEYLSNLNKLIKLERKKRELYEKVKKKYLERIFGE